MSFNLFDGRYKSDWPVGNHRFFDNMIENLPLSLQHPHVGQFSRALSGIPALIMGAGPSLQEGLLELGSAADHMVKICVDAAVVPAVHAGVNPNLIVTCDPSRLTAGFVPSPSELRRGTVLAYDPSAHPETIRAWHDNGGKCMVFGLKEAGFVEIWNLTSRASVSGTGSVTSVSLGLAHELGCNPIIMAGADFCWEPGELTHARGSAATVPERLVSQCIRHTAYDGRAVLTTSDFLRSAWVMEGQLKEPKVSHYRVGRAGLLDLPEYCSGEEAGIVDMVPLLEMVEAATDWNIGLTERMTYRVKAMLEVLDDPKTRPLPAINVSIEFFIHPENDKKQLMQDAKNYVIGGIRKLL